MIFVIKFGCLQTNDLGEMLDEDPSLMGRRQELAKRLELYQKARDEINAAFTR
jgi:Dynamin GTPase effector domain